MSREKRSDVEFDEILQVASKRQKWASEHGQLQNNCKMHKATESPQSRKLGYLRSTGFVSLVCAIGTMLMQYYFWWFVAFTCVGIGIAISDSILEKPLGRFRYWVSGFLTLALIGFLVGFVWGHTKPIIGANWNAGNYTSGENIHGLKWQQSWSQLVINITNNEDVELEDFDLKILIDAPVAEIKQIDALPCSQPLPANGSILDITGTDANGVQHPMPIGASVQSYRFFCGKIPSHMAINLIAALISPSAMGAQPPERFPKEKPDWVHVHVVYKARMRPYELDWKILPTQSP